MKMLAIRPAELTEVARKNGWLHTRGRLKDTINASRMATGLGVDKSTVSRIYDGGPAGVVFLEKLISVGASLDALVVRKSP
jgi:hypothetical protein